jgi:Protein of unknown function (DUF3631)/Domain of unknown function (DUF3854)
MEIGAVAVSDDPEIRLADHHRAALDASGIPAELAAAREYRTVTDRKQLAEIGITPAGRRVPGLLVPLLDVRGSTWGYQFRPDSPRTLGTGRLVRYESPTSQRNGLDVPAGVGPMLGDPAIPLWITEGSKKADCAAAQGLCCVALLGVWSWRGTNKAGGQTALPDWQDVALKDRRVILAFDGDVARKESVRGALDALASYLGLKGARIAYAHLPDDDTKVGLDDYLTSHSVEQLWQLVKPTRPLRRTGQLELPLDLPEPRRPVDGVALLDDLERFAGRFLALPSEHHLVVVVLWAMHTWSIAAFYTTPRLVCDSPEPESGKTRVLEVLRFLCRDGRLIVSTSCAALFRRIDAADDRPPTILQDEADAVWHRGDNSSEAKDLRALFDNGYRRGAVVDRCVGDRHELRAFKVFAPVALAGLAGKIPATIISRSITFHMRRRAPDEHVDEFRERDVIADANPLRERMDAWNAAHLDALASARPTMPAGVRDRRAEAWEPLLAIADAIGGDWPTRARAACEHFEHSATDDRLSLGTRLLQAVHTAFDGSDRMFSVDIVRALTADPESEWRDMWGKPIDQRRLAKELKRYGVESRMLRIGSAQARGYQVDGDTGLQQAWRRYLPQPSVPSVTSVTSQVTDITLENAERNKRTTSVTPETASELHVYENGTDGTAVTDSNGSAEPLTHDQALANVLSVFPGARIVSDEYLSSKPDDDESIF